MPRPKKLPASDNINTSVDPPIDTTNPQEGCVDVCDEINEGIPVNPLPNKNLPELIGASIVNEEENNSHDTKSKNKKTKQPSKKEGIQEALDILDEYYKDTPTRDNRFSHHEE